MLRSYRSATFIWIWLALAALFLVLYAVPRWQVRHATPPPIDAFAAENDARRTLAQVLGGLGLLIGLYFTKRTVDATRDGQITDRFTKAIEQLGSDKEEVRLGGIYALERIARDSERDHRPIVEVLTAFVRERVSVDRATTGADDQEVPLVDVQAALTVLGRRLRYFRHGEEQPLDLARISLTGADLRDAHLEGASLWNTYLRHAQLEGAHLDEADLTGALLIEANLREAGLNRADLTHAELAGADLRGAHLTRANLSGANLLKALLDESHLEGADLTDVVHLTQKQLDVARVDRHTRLPAGLERRTARLDGSERTDRDKGIG